MFNLFREKKSTKRANNYFNYLYLTFCLSSSPSSVLHGNLPIQIDVYLQNLPSYLTKQNKTKTQNTKLLITNIEYLVE